MGSATVLRGGFNFRLGLGYGLVAAEKISVFIRSVCQRVEQARLLIEILSLARPSYLRRAHSD